MFTGLVEEIGQIKKVDRTGSSCRLTIACHKVLEGTKAGDSIAVNGTCLTVTAFDGSTFSCDVTPETMRRTAFSLFAAGTPVNLERALRFCDRLGGHIVLGHVDFTGRILSSEKEGIALNLTFSAEEKYMKYILEKGSVAVDGVSLTVAKRGDSSFMISLIPHTGSLTVLSTKRIGDQVNIECDYLGKYIEQLMQKEHEGVTTKRLKDLGYGGHYGI